MDAQRRTQNRMRARQETARLAAEGVRAVALTFVDNAGITRVKTVPVDRLPDAARWGVGMSPVFDVYLADDSATTSRFIGGPDGDLRLFPDLDALTVLAAQPGWAHTPVDRYDQQYHPYPGCQRAFARRQAQRAREQGFELRMGFETEWIVTRADTGRYPTEGPAYGMVRLVEMADYLRAVLDALTEEGVEVLQLHPEYAPGQFEVSTVPAEPVAAADLAVLVRETVRAVSVQHGLRASFAPAFEAFGVGNGGHLHLSLWQDGANLLRGGPGPHGLTRTGESFLAGIFDALPALLAIGVPSPAGYLRLVPSRWAGAYHCWGLENREAALRLITGSPDDPGAANAEVHSFDSSANPYLAVGAVIAAGLEGIGTQAKLPPPVQGDPALGPPGGPERLPTTLPQALEHFERAAVLRTALGDPLFEAIAAVRKAEAERFGALSPQQLADATRWRY